MNKEKALDADFNETDGVHDIRTLLPCMSVDFGIFAKDIAYYHDAPIEFVCERNSESNTGVRFYLSFTDELGKEHTITSKYFRQLLLQAAAIERKATHERIRIRTRSLKDIKKEQKREREELPLFTHESLTEEAA